jgi:hypothetical protein
VEPKLWHWQGLPVSIYRAGNGSETVQQDIVAAHRLKWGAQDHSIREATLNGAFHVI